MSSILETIRSRSDPYYGIFDIDGSGPAWITRDQLLELLRDDPGDFPDWACEIRGTHLYVTHPEHGCRPFLLLLPQS